VRTAFVVVARVSVWVSEQGAVASAVLAQQVSRVVFVSVAELRVRVRAAAR